MKLEHYSVERLKENVISILQEYLDLREYRVFFFGSRVEGGGTERSDIDIGIEGREPVPAEAWVNIQEKIADLPTLYTVEIVDFRRVSPIFKKIALRQIESIELKV